MIELRLETSLLGKRVDSVVGVTVTDDAVLGSVERRRKHPSLSVMALLENEIQSPVIYDPEMFERALSSRTNRDSNEAIDLLLGTQGWRRFAYKNSAEWLSAKGEDQRSRDSRERVMAVHEMKIMRRERMFKNARRFDDVAAPVMYMMAAAPMIAAGAAPEMLADAPPMAIMDKMDDFAENGLPPEENIIVMPGFELPRPPLPPRKPTIAVARVYAHSQRKFSRHEIESGPLVRSDFTETVYWSASMRT